MSAFSLLHSALKDLLIQKGVLKREPQRKGFAFLVHPRDVTDAVRKYPFARYLPKRFIEFWAANFWPVVASQITGVKSLLDGSQIPGWIIVCPLLPKQLLSDKKKGIDMIVRCVDLAEKLGAKIVGLGALTASITRGGLDIHNSIRISVTSGYAYTSILITENVLKLAGRFSLPIGSVSVAVVGAAGFIGYTTTKLLVRKGIRDLILIDLPNKLERLQHLTFHLKGSFSNLSIRISHDVSDIKVADFIVAATNAPKAIITSDFLKPGSVVIDDAQPSDVDPDVIKSRDDVLVIEAAVASAPSIDLHFNFGLADRSNIFGCLGEVILLASKGDFQESFTGEPDEDMINYIELASRQTGFGLARWQNFLKVYSEEDLDRIKEARKNK